MTSWSKVNATHQYYKSSFRSMHLYQHKMANPQSNVYSAEGSLIEKVEPLLSRFGLKNNFPCIWSKRSVQSIKPKF